MLVFWRLTTSGIILREQKTRESQHIRTEYFATAQAQEMAPPLVFFLRRLAAIGTPQGREHLNPWGQMDRWTPFD